MRLILIISLFAFSNLIFGQSPYILPGTLSDEIADRWDILFDFEHSVFAGQRNTSRKELAQRAYHIFDNSALSKLDKWDVRYILRDNNEYSASSTNKIGNNDLPSREKIYDSSGVFYHLADYDKNQNEGKPQAKENSLFGHFYKSHANFYELNAESFKFRANPILNLKFGKGANDSAIIFQNTRGVEIRGLIDDNVYFYTSILENQAHFNNYLEDRIDQYETIGGQGFFKEYKSGLIENLKGHDYLNAQAYVGINATKSVAIEFGHGKHFIGHGIRSLLLSDYSTNYFYLKFNTRIWKFHYQNVFAELAPVSAEQNKGDKLLPKKYAANHYLSFRPNKNLEFGIFETVVFSREDKFEFQYLNPVILYRTVEQFLDSPDNVLIGLNAKWNIKKRAQLYGQLLLDEFKLSRILKDKGWWANKYGIQIGGKMINLFGVDHLDAQIEYNVVRPYTYAHRDTLISFPNQSTASYSHHNQPLAHPLGSNFKELLINFRYRPTKNIFVNARIINTSYGQNPEGINVGSNILLETGSKESRSGNFIGQGVSTSMQSLSLDVSYQLAHNYFIDLNFLYRNADAELDDRDIETKYIGGGLRVNLGNIISDY